MPRPGHVKRRTAYLIGGGVAAVAGLAFALSVARLLRDIPPAPAGERIAVRPPAVSPAPQASKPAHPVQKAPSLSTSSPGDRAAAFKVKRVLDIPGPFRHGQYKWDEAGVPQGPVVITIDLKAQTLSVFRDGYEIGAAVILYGATDKPSPTGVFPILQKDADHYSNLYDNAPMPYSLRLTQDGVFIHGSDVQWGNATHGCIGVPTPFAKRLFGVAKLGDPVIITDGKTMHVG